MLEVIACSAAACDRAAWRCVAASRSLPAPRLGPAWRCSPSSSIRAPMASIGGRSGHGGWPGLRLVAHVVSMLWAQAVVTVDSGRRLAGLLRLARRRRILAGGRRVSPAALHNWVPVMSATGVVCPRAVHSARIRAAAPRMAARSVSVSSAVGGRRLRCRAPAAGPWSRRETVPPGATPRTPTLTGAVVHRVAADAYVR